MKNLVVIDALTAFYILNGDALMASVHNEQFESDAIAKEFAENISRLPELVEHAKNTGFVFSEAVYEKDPETSI